TATLPACNACPLKRICIAHLDGTTSRIPHRSQRPKTLQRQFIAFVVEHRGRYLVRQRPTGVVNAHLWEFPNVEVNNSANGKVEWARERLGLPLKSMRPLAIVKHTITRYRNTLEVFQGILLGPKSNRTAPYWWFRFPGLKRLAFPSAHRKIVERLARKTAHGDQ